MTPTLKPRDLVTRTGESVPWCGVFQGEDYIVAEVVNERGWFTLEGVLNAEWPPRGFRPAETEEGKS